MKDFEKNCLNDDIRNALVKNGGRKDVNTNVFILSEAELNENLNDLEADSTTQLEEREVEAQKNGLDKPELKDEDYVDYQEKFEEDIDKDKEAQENGAKRNIRYLD